MESIDYWRNWTPGKKIIEEHPQTGLTKPPKPSSVGFGGPSPGCVSIIYPEHEAWVDDFRAWMRERCVSRLTHQDWGSIGSLYCDFGEWLVLQNIPCCSRQSYEVLEAVSNFSSHV